MFKSLQDEDVEQTEAQKLDEYPAKKLTLFPGGYANYEFSINASLVNAFIKPAPVIGDYNIMVRPQ